jgi:cell division protease FtsH
MAMLLGGRAAEEVVFGAVTTGASDDLNRVAETSRAMVHDYAMGTTLSSLRVSHEGGAVSDRTRQMRDEEQQHLADEALRMALRLVSAHREQLDALAHALLRNEVLLREDIEEIMKDVAHETSRGVGNLRMVAATDGTTAPPPAEPS